MYINKITVMVVLYSLLFTMVTCNFLGETYPLPFALSMATWRGFDKY